MKRFQAGLATVELAIIGVLLFVVVFAVIELGRALFVVNALTEASRRGARMAAVCPVGDPKPASVAVFDSGNGTSSVVSGLTASNVLVQYLDVNGAPLANPTGNFTSIRYVRVSIVGFTLSLIIPTLMSTIPISGLSTTLPRESLGIPRSGVVQPC